MTHERPTVGSLFSGIGGMDLGLERAGFDVRWQVEWDAWCQRVLAKHWPDVPRYGDITTVDWSGVERVDLLAGGFPCQPFSNAGRRRGKADDRWLWPAFAAAIGVLRPRLVLVENVPGLLAGHGGMGSVLGDLAALGYDAEWDSIPAAAVGAPHLRYRVWIVAHRQGDASRPDADGERSHRAGVHQRRGSELRHEQVSVPRSLGRSLADAGRFDGGSLPRRRSGAVQGIEVAGRPTIEPDRRRCALADAYGAGSQGYRGLGALWGGAGEWVTRAGRESVEGQWRSEPDVGRVAHGVPSRVDRLRGLGNAVVPQVVEVIGRQLITALEVVA